METEIKQIKELISIGCDNCEFFNTNNDKYCDDCHPCMCNWVIKDEIIEKIFNLFKNSVNK